MLSDDDRVVLYMRRGCHVCARVKAFLADNGVDFETREVDEEPLTPRELWDLFNKKAGRLRVPFTALNDGEDVVLGYDPTRLEGVFLRGELGGWQTSAPVERGERTYDDFTGNVDTDKWVISGTSGQPVDQQTTTAEISCAEGEMHMNLAPAGENGASERLESASTERFATPGGSDVGFAFGMAVGTPERPAAEARSGYGEGGLQDHSGGVFLGFRATDRAIFAVHQRVLTSGVNMPEDCYAHRVLLDTPTAPGRMHGYAVHHGPEPDQVRWYVDDALVYWATLPRPVEGVSLSMAVALPVPDDPAGATGGNWDTRARWTPWRVSSL